MASTILRHSRQLPWWILSRFCSPLLTCHGHYSNWMSRTLSYMGIFRRKFIWSNLQAMLLRGRQKSVVSRRPYMDLSRVQSVVWEVQPYYFWYWLYRCHYDHSVFVRRTKSDIVVMIVYVDEILLTDVIQLGYWRQRSILSTILSPRTWDVQNTFWKLKLHIKNTVYFFPNGSMLWIFWRK